MGTVTRPGRFACLRWTCDPAWRATYQPKSRTRTRSASLPVMRGALGMVEVESLLSVEERDTETLDRALRATASVSYGPVPRRAPGTGSGPRGVLSRLPPRGERAWAPGPRSPPLRCGTRT